MFGRDGWDNKSSIMELGSIERASKNTPIQGASADMTKLALTKVAPFPAIEDIAKSS